MTHQFNDNVKISRLTSDCASDAFSLACEVFVEASVLHAAINISVEEYKHYLAGSFEAMWRQGLSLVVTDTQTNEIIGCLIACDYLTQDQSLITVPDKLKPVNALLNRLDEMYRNNRQLETGQCMLVDMAVVIENARGQGIYRKLRESAHQIGRKAGYTLVVGELSSTATQQLCVSRFNHKVCAEIEYSSYKYKEHYPFSTIETPRSIILAEGNL